MADLLTATQINRWIINDRGTLDQIIRARQLKEFRLWLEGLPDNAPEVMQAGIKDIAARHLVQVDALAGELQTLHDKLSSWKENIDAEIAKTPVVIPEEAKRYIKEKPDDPLTKG